MSRIALAAVAKNEAATIKEWLAYHAEIGFTDAIIYDNNSDDGTAEEALKASSALDVEIISWPERGGSYQTNAYDDAARRSRRRIDWVAFFDCDEFLCCPGDGDVRSMLQRLENASAIALNWAVFGSSGHMEPPRGLVTENYRRRAIKAFAVNNHTKMIIRPDAYVRAINAHYIKTTHYPVDADGDPILWTDEGKTATTSGFECARLNHYFTKSKADWIRKLSRGYSDNLHRKSSEFERYDRN